MAVQQHDVRAEIPRREHRAAGTLRPLAGRALCALLLIWAGMLIGVSFLAAPARFQAASLTLPVALDVAREVFGTFNAVEIGLAVLVTALALATRVHLAAGLLVALLAVIVALQALWLLPVLDARVDLVLQGVAPPPGPWHALYGALEVTKLVALLAAALLAVRSGARQGASGTT